MSELNDHHSDPNRGTYRPGDKIPEDSVVGNSALWHGAPKPRQEAVNRPLTKGEREAAELAWQVRQQEHEFSGELELSAQPTAWQSLPSAVRFAIWLWTITVIVGFVAAVMGGLVFLITFASAVSG